MLPTTPKPTRLLLASLLLTTLSGCGSSGTGSGNSGNTTSDGSTTGGNQPPAVTEKLQDDTATTSFNHAVLIDVVANDSVETATLDTLTLATAPQHGSATVENGKIRYTPDNQYMGSDQFTYQLGNLTASVHIDITVDQNLAITQVSVHNHQATASAAPVTFGHLFQQGDVPSGKTVLLTTLAGVTIPTQAEHKTHYSDGSLKHGILTADLPEIAAKSATTFLLIETNGTHNQSNLLSTNDLLTTGFQATIKITERDTGKSYFGYARDMLNQPSGTWQNNSQVAEWHGGSPLTDSSGNPHPHLAGYFDVRYYQDGTTRTSFNLENGWTYESDPRNYNYDVELTVNGQAVYQQNDLVHYTHARWRKVGWEQNGSIKQRNWQVKYDIAYLIKTGAVPNYDLQLLGKIDRWALDKEKDKWLETNTDSETHTMGDGITVRSNVAISRWQPMGRGPIYPRMGTAGERDDFGPLPNWTSRYLLSQDYYAYKVTMGAGETAGSFPVHYRDKSTLNHLSGIKYPRVTHLSALSYDQKHQPSATCKLQGEDNSSADRRCKTPFIADVAHQPSLAFVPYLISGDRYFLDEMQFWANFNYQAANPEYRSYEAASLRSNETRGVAWSMRNLAQTAYSLPDDSPEITPSGKTLKAYFTDMLNDNLSWFADYYVYEKESATPATYITRNINYHNNVGWVGPAHYGQPTISPWMDDFVTWAWAYIIDLGYDTVDANAFFHWKTKFPISRMTSTSFCWQYASHYRYLVAPRDTASANNGEAWFTTYEEGFMDTMYHQFRDRPQTSGLSDDAFENYVSNLGCETREIVEFMHGSGTSAKNDAMLGYHKAPSSYSAYLAVVLAKAKQHGIGKASEAYDKIMNRSERPVNFIDHGNPAARVDSYAMTPKWAILPRTP